jgi:hypothetical protein
LSWVAVSIEVAFVRDGQGDREADRRLHALVRRGGSPKTIAARFADIKDSVELMEVLDPEEVDPALQLMMDSAHRYEGHIAQSTGDGIFALFGASIAHWWLSSPTSQMPNAHAKLRRRSNHPVVGRPRCRYGMARRDDSLRALLRMRASDVRGRRGALLRYHSRVPEMNARQAVICILCILLLAIQASCRRPEPSGPVDTPDNRRRAAERYLQVVTPEDLMRDTAEKVATNLPETKRKRFLDTMTKRLDFETINEVMIRSMVNRFTVREIDALANFNGSPEGKSVMKKFGLFMADVAPTIQAETTKALAKIGQAPQ